MSEKKSRYEVKISDGDGWSAGKAITLSINGSESIMFGNEWDSTVPLSKEWRDVQKVKIDFSGITLDSSEEEIQKRKEDFLKQYPAPGEDGLDKAVERYQAAKSEDYRRLDFEHNINTALNEISNVQTDKDSFGKYLSYFNEVIDEASKGWKGNRHAIKNPFAKWYKFRDRDPAQLLKDVGSFANDSFESDSVRFTKLVKEVKDYLPKTYEECMELRSKSIIKLAQEAADAKFPGVSQNFDKAETELKKVAMQIGINEIAGQLFDQQLSDHKKMLEEEALKTHVAERKEALKSSVQKRKKEGKRPSDVAMSDKLAQVVIEENRHHKKLQEIGVANGDKKSKMLTPAASRALIDKIQKNQKS